MPNYLEDYQNDQGEFSGAGSSEGGDFGPEQVQRPPQPPPIPPTWSQADDIDLQRLVNGQSVARQKFQAGEWGQETFDSMQNQIGQQVAPLMARKQAAQQLQQQQEEQAALKANAMRVGLRAHDMQTAAQTFPNQIATHADAEGNETQFYQSEPGKFAPIPAKEEMAPPDAQTDQADVPVLSGEDLQVTADPVVIPGSQPVPGGHVMTIQNGQWVQREHFDANGRSIGTEYPRDAQGREVKPPWVREQEAADAQTNSAANALGISAADSRAIDAQARLATPRFLRTGNPARDQRAAFEESRQLAENKRMLTAKLLQQKALKTKEQVTISAEERKKNAELTVKQKTDLYERKLKELQSDADQYHKGQNPRPIPAGGLPDYLTDRQAMEEEAHQRAQRDYKRIHNKDWHADAGDAAPTTTGSESGAATPAESNPPKVEPEKIKADASILAAALAEKARRAQQITGPEPLTDEQIRIRKRLPAKPLSR
jgi:hypothetical protein